jgi:hypothetical protein
MSARRFGLASVLALSLAVVTGAGLPSTSQAQAVPEVYADIVKGVALAGYDPIGYFTDGKPVLGLPSITLQHQGAEWRFASEANRDAFKADPAKYAPQYGGYCAWAVSQGYTAKGDPNAWTIANGKLYLNYNKSVQKSWEKDIPGNVAKGDKNWPRVLGKS